MSGVAARGGVSGVTSFGAYVPRMRLERAAVAAAHRWMAPWLKGLGKGARAFCSWDEDAVTMAVEAARDAVSRDERGAIESLTLASTTLPYADLQSSGIVAGALGLSPRVRTLDAGGSPRVGLSALAAALRGGSDALVVASDRPRAKPASTQEMVYGAGAAAFRVGSGRVLARLLGSGVHNAAFVDHFRPSDDPYDYVWEERWVRDEGYAKLFAPAVKTALAEANVAIGDVNVLVLASPLKGAAAAVGKQLGFTGALAESFDDGCGYAGAAHPLLMLAGALEVATRGQKILVLGFGQGSEALLLETTDAIAEAGAAKARRGVRGSLAAKVSTDDYLRFAAYYGEIAPDWGMKSERTGKAALTTQYRESAQLAAFVAGRCPVCTTVQFPRLEYCVNPECASPAKAFTDYPLTEEPAKVLTATADWLSYHLAPPLYVGFAQFAVGARLLMEIVDVGPAGIDVGAPLEMVFRIKEPDRARGYNRYFWKATPLLAPASATATPTKESR